MKQGITIIFPGIAYTCEEKLLVQCAEKYKEAHYDIVNLDFSCAGLNLDESLEYNFMRTKNIILKQIDKINFDEYSDVVFISKSIGTSSAAWLENYLKVNVRQYFLTPIELCLEYIKNTSNVMIMVIGTNDRFIDYRNVQSFCLNNNIKYIVFDGVGHSLKYKDDIEKTEQLNKKVVELLTVL